MKSIETVLHERRSIRRYTREKLTEEQKEYIYEAIRAVPTSYNGQQFSVVAVENQETKEALYEIMGQKQVKTCALFLLFCIDFHKAEVLAKAKGLVCPHFESTIDGYTVGVVDASLAMMAAGVAAESLGLGSCCIGYARTSNPVKVSEIMGLPKGVAIVCGLTIGFPNEIPDLKPKQPSHIVVHREKYCDDTEIEKELVDYDKKITDYNQARTGAKSDNDWITHILDYHVLESKHSIVDYLRTQIGLGKE